MSRFTRELAQVQWPLPVAEWQRIGTTKDQLLGRRWARTSRGRYRPRLDEPTTTTQRIVDVATNLPAGAAIAGWSAAYVHGVDLLDGYDDFTMRPRPVMVRMPPGFHRTSTSRVRYVQPARSITIHQAYGLPVTPIAVAALDMARWAANLVEAVVSLDAVLASKLVRTPDALDVDDRTGPGSRQLKRAVDLCRPGVRSTWESRLRMFYVLTLGLPVPLVNPPLFDRGGAFLGVSDLLDEEAGLAMEYDGSRWSTGPSAGHRDFEQHRRDNHREEGLERANLVVVRADRVDLTREQTALARRISAARADGLRRDRSRDRWTRREPPGWRGLPA